MKIYKEEDVLDSNWRKNYIEWIKSDKNQARKIEARKRDSVYQDNTKEWVIKALSKEFSKDTVDTMESRASNISIGKKVINKKANTYQAGVNRKVESANDQPAIDLLSDELDFNTHMKRVDVQYELQKNCLVQVIPKVDVNESTDGKELYELQMRVFSPAYYDPIIDARDCTSARGFVLSESHDEVVKEHEVYQGQRNKNFVNPPVQDAHLSGKDKETFIFWTNKYHFTTDCDGTIIGNLSPDDLLNPIQLMPFVHVSEKEEGKYFSTAGKDLIDGSILINILITDMFTIANVQGWGQPVMTGANLPQKVETGPHNAILLQQNAGDPTPTFDFVSSNPPIQNWMQMIEQYTALLLSTNNLSPSSVSIKLDSNTYPSGIAMLIEKSEINFDIEDKQMVFQDAEPDIWEVVKRWQNLYFDKKLLCEDFMAIGKFEDSDVQLTFNRMKSIVTEKEKLEIIKMRKELGINTEIELLKMDNPDLTDEEAMKKLLELKTTQMEKIKDEQVNMIQAMGNKVPLNDANNQDNMKGAPNGKSTNEEEKTS